MVQLEMERQFHLIQYGCAWVAMVLIAIANGALRQLTFAKALTELRAHQLSTAIGAFLIGLFIWAVFRMWPPASTRQALVIGLIWMALTVAFEFILGRLVMRRPWSQLLSEYNVLSGRVWTLFLIWLALAPYVLLRFHCGP